MISFLKYVNNAYIITSAMSLMSCEECDVQILRESSGNEKKKLIAIGDITYHIIHLILYIQQYGNMEVHV